MHPTICFEKSDSAEIYDKNSSVQYLAAKKFIEENHHLVAKCKLILDVGCGSGRIAHNLLAVAAPKSIIHAIDLNRAMIEVANKRYKIPNIDYSVCDVENMIFVRTFDLVFSCYCLQWLPDQTTALKKIHRSLKLGGMLMIILPSKSDKSIFPIGKSVAESNIWRKRYPLDTKCQRSYYSKKEYLELLSSIGFIDIEISERETVTTFDTINELREWIKPICQFYEKLPLDIRDEFLSDVVLDVIKNHTSETVAGHYVDPDSKINLCLRETYVRAVLKS